MKKVLLYALLFLTIAVVSFYFYIGISFGKGVAKAGNDLHNVQKEWKKNKENPLDTIENIVIEKMDSANNKTKKSKLRTKSLSNLD